MVAKVASKNAILASARDQFAGLGFEKATIRSIAKAAGVDPALVIHYFGSKQELFMAVMLPLAKEHLDSRIEVLQGAVTVEELAEIWVPLTASTLADSEFTQLLVALIRASASEPKAAEMLQEVAANSIERMLEHLMPPAEAQIRASLIGSTFIGLLTCSHIIKGRIAEVPPEDLSHYIIPVLNHYLTMPIQAVPAN